MQSSNPSVKFLSGSTFPMILLLNILNYYILGIIHSIYMLHLTYVLFTAAELQGTGNPPNLLTNGQFVIEFFICRRLQFPMMIGLSFYLLKVAQLQLITVTLIIFLFRLLNLQSNTLIFDLHLLNISYTARCMLARLID